jgi:acetoin:2,6-dichlorophenolindophenol oxidoreductase subunit beta
VGLAIGAAMAGMRPVVELLFMDFALVAADQIVNQAAKVRYMSGGLVSVPLVIRAQQGGGRGNGAQHSQSFESWLAQVPGLIVVAPSTPAEAKGLLKSAIRAGNPVVFIEHKLLYNTKGEVPEGQGPIPIGKAEIKRWGRDVTIVSYSRSLLQALEAAELLAGKGIEAEVVDLRTIAPLDMDTVCRAVQDTGRLLVVHESHATCGLGAEIIAQVYERIPDALVSPARRLGAKHVPIPVAEPLENAVLPQVTDIVDEVVITLGIETNDFDLSVAKRQNDQVVRSVLDLTQKYAIDSRYVQTDYIHIEPRYESGIQRRQNFLGYFVQKTIEIRLRDVSMFENFYSDVLEAGVTHVQGIEFRTTELRKYRDQARELALTAAKEKAVAMSAVLDQMIGQVKMIREDRSDWSGSYSWWWGSQGGFMAQNVIQNQGGAAFTEEGTLAPGQISVSAIVTVEFELVK